MIPTSQAPGAARPSTAWIRRAAPWAVLGLLWVGATGCDKGASDSGSGVAASGGDGTPDAIQRTLDAGMAVPQEELARAERVVHVRGTLVVDGYTEGRLQIDVFRKAAGPQRPVTTARFNAPGEFDVLLPAGVGKVELMGILDIAGDGPDREDPRSPYSGNPITVETADIKGIELRIDKAAVMPTPPLHQPPQPNEGAGQPAIDTDDSEEILLRPDGDAQKPAQ